MTRRHLTDLKKSLQSNFVKYWSVELHKSEKLRTYRKLKSIFMFEKYLHMFPMIQIAAIWLVLGPAVINYLLSMVDILPQKLLLQRGFANNV